MWRAAQHNVECEPLVHPYVLTYVHESKPVPEAVLAVFACRRIVNDESFVRVQ